MGTEFKRTPKGPKLGTPQREIPFQTYNSGIPVREDTRGNIEIIRYIENMLGLSSWIDNI